MTFDLATAQAKLARRVRGRQAHRAGANWERTVVALAKRYGWLVHHQRPARTAQGWRSAIMGNPGFPDIVLVHPKGDILVLELKTGEARTNPQQREWIAAIAAAGVECYVARPEDADALAERLSRPAVGGKVIA